jgi:hypothetical protein
MAPDDLNHEIARIPVGAGLSPVATYHCKALADYLNVKYDGKEGYVSELDVSGA